MDAFQAVSGYVTKMVSTGDSAAGANAAKMKILLLDNDTVSNHHVFSKLHPTDMGTGIGRVISNYTIRSPESPSLPDRSLGQSKQGEDAPSSLSVFCTAISRQHTVLD
jgi:hypothetical protein